MAVTVVDETLVDLEDASDCALAVSAARTLAGEAGFGETDRFLFATAVSELATNIIRYAKRGTITISLVKKLEHSGLVVTARDEGPGIAVIEQAMTENYSSGGSLGLGLPSVKRIMDEFEIQSEPGRGTVVIGRKWRY